MWRTDFSNQALFLQIKIRVLGHYIAWRAGVLFIGAVDKVKI
jgi:hypothetical protein